MGIKDIIRDKGLEYLQANGNTLLVCSSDPADYAAAVAATIGSKSVTIGAPQTGTGGGRKCVLPAQTGGDISVDGNADFWAITNGVDELYATGDIADKIIDDENTFSTTVPIEVQFDA